MNKTSVSHVRKHHYILFFITMFIIARFFSLFLLLSMTRVRAMTPLLCHLVLYHSRSTSENLVWRGRETGGGGGGGGNRAIVSIKIDVCVKRLFMAINLGRLLEKRKEKPTYLDKNKGKWLMNLGDLSLDRTQHKSTINYFNLWRYDVKS